jgi:ferredoxin-NADP reductase
LPGQWALFMFEDEQWQFQRSYSIVHHDIDNEKTTLVFAIKLSENWRGSTIIRRLSLWSSVLIGWIFGNFSVQNTLLPKVFIGTWIWILPLLSMAKHCMTKKQLFFSISHKKDLFYEDRIREIPGLFYKIHISQESIPWYESWRIDFIQQHFDPNTEFYLSWKPETIENIIEKIKFLGYKRIYVENF